MTLKNINENNVNIKVINKQKNQNGLDKIEILTEGKFHINNDKFYIMYKHNYEDAVDSYMIKVDREIVTIKRSGVFSSNIVLNKDIEHSFLYHMPYGDLAMVAKTEFVGVFLGENGGELKLRYTLNVQGDRLHNDMSIIITTM